MSVQLLIFSWICKNRSCMSHDKFIFSTYMYLILRFFYMVIDHNIYLKIFKNKFIYFHLEDNYFTILCYFCHTSTWISHRYTYVPLPLEFTSHLPPHPTPLGCHRAPSLNFSFHCFLFTVLIATHLFKNILQKVYLFNSGLIWQ